MSPIARILDEGVDVLTRNWWAVVLRGVIALLFGVLALTVPALSLVVLVYLFAGYALADGILALVSVARGRGTGRPWGALLLEGLAGIAAGVLTVLWPGISAIALLFVIAMWALITGIFEIVQAVRLRKHVEGEWLLALDGVLSIALGVLLFARPAAGALAVVFIIGAYAILFGVLLVGLGLRLRSWRSRAHRALEPRAPGPVVAQPG